VRCHSGGGRPARHRAHVVAALLLLAGCGDPPTPAGRAEATHARRPEPASSSGTEPPIAARQEKFGWELVRVTRAVSETVDDATAARLRALTHPSGRGGMLTRTRTEPDGEGYRAYVAFTWSGGLTRRNYTTAVAWRFSATDHIASSVDGDESPVPVSAANRTRLDEYCREHLYPRVRAAVRSR